jgi:hypothetical protein
MTGVTAPGAQRVSLGDLLLDQVCQPDRYGRCARHDLSPPGFERGVHREAGLYDPENDQAGGGHHDRQEQLEPDRAQPSGAQVPDLFGR